MTVEEAQAALDEAQKAFDAAKGTGVRNVTAASKALSAAKRALATAQKAEAAGVNVGGLSRAEQLSTIRQAEYTAAQEEAGRGEKPTPPPADDEYTYDYVWRSEVGGRGGYWSLVRYQKYGTQTGAGNTGTGNINTGNINTGNINTGNVDTGNVNTGNINTGNINTGNINTGNIVTGPTLAKDVFKQTLALYFGNTELTKGWMDELYNAVSKFYKNGTDVATSLNMALLDSRNNPNLKAFTDRFKGIYALQDLRQAGKPVNVPTIAEYVAAQKGMADILNEAGLGDISTEQFTGELIGKGNSVSTVADKIGNVYQRIDMAPKEIKDTLSRYFPTVDRTTLAKTILLGEKGVTQLVDELNKYDVLAAAEQQGIAATGAKGIVGGVTEERAKEYARAGGTFSSLMPKFAEVRKSTPVVSKLAGISKAQDIGQLGVEQALISGLSQPMETIQQLGEEEIGRFSGKAGRAELGLASQRRANRAF
jgi:hypothetical protein